MAHGRKDIGEEHIVLLFYLCPTQRVIARYEAIFDTRAANFSIEDCHAIARNDVFFLLCFSRKIFQNSLRLFGVYYFL